MILLKKLLNKNLFININELSKLNLIIIFSIFIFFVTIISLTFYYNFILLYPDIINVENNIVYKKIPFEYGKLLENLINYKKYYSTISVLGSEVDFYLNRMPMLPLIFLFINFFSSKLFFLILIKNLIFFSILFFTLLELSKEKKFNLLFFVGLNIIFFYNIYNLKIISNFVYADFITSILMPILFLISISNFKFKYFYIGLIIFILYLSKANMFPICFVVSLYFLFFEKQKIPIIFCLLAIISWGSFGYIKTGKFPIGSSILSTSSHALSLSFNKNFKKFYPLISVDYIESCDLTNVNKVKLCKNVPDEIKTEWDFYNFYKKQNEEYLAKHKKIILRDIILKIKTIFFNFYEDGQIYQENKFVKKNFDIFIFINKIFLILSIILVLRSLVIKPFNFFYFKKEIIYFLILFSSLPSFLLGWALNRHLVFLFLISQLYILLNLKLNKND